MLDEIQRSTPSQPTTSGGGDGRHHHARSCCPGIQNSLLYKCIETQAFCVLSEKSDHALTGHGIVRLRTFDLLLTVRSYREIRKNVSGGSITSLINSCKDLVVSVIPDFPKTNQVIRATEFHMKGEMFSIYC
jgi:hypothetical protein